MLSAALRTAQSRVRFSAHGPTLGYQMQWADSGSTPGGSHRPLGGQKCPRHCWKYYDPAFGGLQCQAVLATKFQAGQKGQSRHTQIT